LYETYDGEIVACVDEPAAACREGHTRHARVPIEDVRPDDKGPNDPEI
jgi:hypothetical protein